MIWLLKRVLVTLFMGLLSAQPLLACAEGMTVKEAYRAIPHQQTTFSLQQSKLPSKDKTYLAAMFALVDEALTYRVATLLWFQSDGRKGQDVETYLAGMETLLAKFDALTPPGRLKGIHQLVVEALVEQRYYFKQWAQNADYTRRFNPRDPSVQNAHKRLVKAYEYLMKYYPQESAHNQQAFFDHLCALDFI